MVKSTLVRLINGIEDYEQSALRSSVYYSDDSRRTYAEVSPNSKLGTFVYCKKEDSLRLMRKPMHSKEEECFTCHANKRELIPVSIEDMSQLVEYLGQNHIVRMIHMLNNWPLKGRFSYKNPYYLYLPEHKKLEKLFIEWHNVAELDQFDEIMDLRNYQMKRMDILNKRDEFLESFYKELSDLEREL